MGKYTAESTPPLSPLLGGGACVIHLSPLMQKSIFNSISPGYAVCHMRK